MSARHIVSALLLIRAVGRDNNPQLALCSTLRRKMEQMRLPSNPVSGSDYDAYQRLCDDVARDASRVARVFVQWPEFSGYRSYPVNAPWPQRLWSTPYAHWQGHNYWTGRYGAARLRLVDFLIGHFTALAAEDLKNFNSGGDNGTA